MWYIKYLLCIYQYWYWYTDEDRDRTIFPDRYYFSSGISCVSLKLSHQAIPHSISPYLYPFSIPSHHCLLLISQTFGVWLTAFLSPMHSCRSLQTCSLAKNEVKLMIQAKWKVQRNYAKKKSNQVEQKLEVRYKWDDLATWCRVRNHMVREAIALGLLALDC